MVKAAVWIYLVILIVSAIVVYFVLRWRKDRPLIHHFKASSIWKAFVLNSIAASLVIFIALTTKKEFDSYTKDHGDDDVTDNDHNVDKDSRVVQKTNPLSVFLTLTSTFMTSMIAYTVLYVLFGFGSGMIAVSSSE